MKGRAGANNPLSNGRNSAFFLGLFLAASPLFADVGSLKSQLNTAMNDGIKHKIGKSKGSHYFMTMFSYQDDKNHPEASHTFATFTEVDASGKKTMSTISWLPADFREARKLCVFKGALWPIPGKNACRSVPGKNYSLDDTLAFAVLGHRHVGMWGPFEIQKELHTKALARISQLNDGGLDYAADDRILRDRGKAVNCLHAVSDLGGTRSINGGPLGTELGMWGFKGTQHILKHFIKNEDTWLADKIDRKNYKEFHYDGVGEGTFPEVAMDPTRAPRLLPDIITRRAHPTH